jgi:hypothetical protein
MKAKVSGQLSKALLPPFFRPPSKLGGLEWVPATSENIDKFIEISVAGIPDPTVKVEAINRMRAGLFPDPAKDDTAAIEEVWRKCEHASHPDFEKEHAAFLRDLVCNETGYCPG